MRVFHIFATESRKLLKIRPEQGYLAELRKFSDGLFMPEHSSKKIGFKGRLVVFGIACVGSLPLSVARGFGALLGWVCWVIQERNSRTTQENLLLCYPDMSGTERRSLAKKSVIETGRLAAEICVIQQRDKAWLDTKITKVIGEDLIRRELAKGKGLILLAPHLGNWEVLSLVLPGYGPMTALYQPPKQAYLEDLIIQSREKTGATLVPTDRRGVVSLLKSIKQGGITAILPDQNPAKGSGEFTPFFGHDAYTMTLVYGLIQRSGCSVIYGFVKRVAKGFEIYYVEAPQGISSEDKTESLEALNKGVEQCISYCPEQYQWEYKRFKKRPKAAK